MKTLIQSTIPNACGSIVLTFRGKLVYYVTLFFFSIVLCIYHFLRSFDPDQNFTPFIGWTCKNYRENAFSWTQRKKIHNSLMNISDVVNAITPFKLMAKPRPHYVFIALPSRDPSTTPPPEVSECSIQKNYLRRDCSKISM